VSYTSTAVDEKRFLPSHLFLNFPNFWEILNCEKPVATPNFVSLQIVGAISRGRSAKVRIKRQSTLYRARIYFTSILDLSAACDTVLRNHPSFAPAPGQEERRHNLRNGLKSTSSHIESDRLSTSWSHCCRAHSAEYCQYVAEPFDSHAN
jgi:hypothetical protein